MTLEGWDAFDAAVHCAAISAGQRLQNDQQQKKKGGASGTSSGGGRLRRMFSRNEHYLEK